MGLGLGLFLCGASVTKRGSTIGAWMGSGMRTKQLRFCLCRCLMYARDWQGYCLGGPGCWGVLYVLVIVLWLICGSSCLY